MSRFRLLNLAHKHVDCFAVVNHLDEIVSEHIGQANAEKALAVLEAAVVELVAPPPIISEIAKQALTPKKRRTKSAGAEAEPGESDDTVS